MEPQRWGDVVTVPGSTAAAPPWVLALTDDVLRSAFGRPTYERGADYARRGLAYQVDAAEDGSELTGLVDGTARTPYFTVVGRPSPSRRVPVGSSECSCPIGGSCKHVVALLLTARDAARDAARQSTGSAGPGRPLAVRSRRSWEDVLSTLVADPAVADHGHTPLGLLLEPVVTSTSSAPRVRISPVVPGRDAWVKTGVSWRSIETPTWRTNHDDDQRGAVLELLAAYRARSGTGRYAYSSYSVTSVHLDELGPTVWHLLASAEDCGVVLTGPRNGPVVELERTPWRVQVDVRRTAAGDLELSGDVRTAEGSALPEGVGFLVGKPAHGVVVVSPGRLSLAPLAGVLDGAVQQLVERGPVTVPTADTTRFFTSYYPAVRRRVDLVSSDGSVVLPLISPPRVVVEVVFDPGHRARVTSSIRYDVGGDDVSFDPGDPTPAPVRDRDAEERLLAPLLDLFRRVDHTVHAGGAFDLSGMAIARFVRDALPVLAASDMVELHVVGEPARYQEAAEAPLVTASASDSADPDWFDLRVTVSVDGEDVPFAALFTALSRGDDAMLLESGTWFRLDRPELERLRALIDEARLLEDRPVDRLRLTPVQAGWWDELVSLGVVASQCERWQRSAGALRSFTELPRPEPPVGFRCTLRPYQLEGYHWLSLLWDLRLGGILADDMGLGKTVQTLAMIVRAREQGELGGEAGPLLIVAPASVVTTWTSQAETFCPELTVVAVRETEGRSGVPVALVAQGADVVVTSYALLRLDAEAYAAVPWAGMVVDEAQFVKNYQAKTYQAARTIPAPFKLAITGTPLENSLMDLWAMLSITSPGLFPSPQRFADTFRRPIESGSDPGRLETLRRRVRPLLLRRTKEQVATDLPPKTEHVLPVELNPAHRRVYDRHLARERQRVLRLVDDLRRNRIAILASLTLLRQLSLDPTLVDDAHAGKIRASKVDVLVEQLHEVAAEGHRALVFSQFTRFLSGVRRRLEAEGISTCYLDGRTRDRSRRIAEFTDGDASVFCISLKAGGVGLNLTAADYVYLLDPWWNPAVEEQAVDRVHRIGQDKPVVIYRLVATGTIEEKVVALQERKRQLFARVVDGGGAGGGMLTAEDIRGLFEA